MPPGIFASIPPHWDGLLLSQKEVILSYLPSLLDPSSLQGLIPYLPHLFAVFLKQLLLANQSGTGIVHLTQCDNSCVLKMYTKRYPNRKKKKKRERACLCRLAFPKSIFKLLKDATLLENSYIWGEWMLEGIFLLEEFFGNS